MFSNRQEEQWLITCLYIYNFWYKEVRVGWSQTLNHFSLWSSLYFLYECFSLSVGLNGVQTLHAVLHTHCLCPSLQAWLTRTLKTLWSHSYLYVVGLQEAEQQVFKGYKEHNKFLHYIQLKWHCWSVSLLSAASAGDDNEQICCKKWFSHIVSTGFPSSTKSWSIALLCMWYLKGLENVI